MTEKQIEFYKYVFELEEKRYSELINRGKLYITTITFYLSLFFFKINDEKIVGLIQEVSNKISILLYITTASLLIALLLGILSIGIYSYERISDLEKVLRSTNEMGQKDESFFEDRAIDFAVATKQNTKINNRKAKLLLFSSFFILVGVISHFIYFLTLIEYND